VTTTAEQRYEFRLDDSDVGPGRDLLLDRPVTVVQLAGAQPGRLARGLRGLRPSPWLRVVDAYEEPDGVVLVLPAVTGTLAEVLQGGVPSHTAQLLNEELERTLTDLAAFGLTVRSLDPASVGTDEDGSVVLLPCAGTRALAAEQAALIARLGGVAPAAEAETEHLPAATASMASPATQPIATPASVRLAQDTAPRITEPPTTEPPTTELHVPRLAAAPRYPRAGLTPAETGRRSGAGGVRTGVLALGAAAAVLGAGWWATGQGAPTGAGGAELAGASSGASSAEEPVDPLAQVQADLQVDPTAVGAGGGDLLQRLRDTAAAEGPRQAFAAAGTLEAIRTGRSTGALEGPLVDEAARAVTPVATPTSVPELVAMAEVDPSAFGPRTPKFLGRLVKLRDDLTGEAARTEAQDLHGIVQAGPAKGEFTPTFAALALPVLSEMAVPDDLAGLVAATTVDPARFGPRTPKFAGRLGKLQTLTGEAAVVEAADLVSIVEAGVGKGEFTAAFRDIAVPVLRPIAEGQAS
jgi:hypothetical protein